MSGSHGEFLEIFRDETRERLDRIVATLLAVEGHSAPADAVDALFREMHTIKGAAGMVGLAEIGDLAHAIEDVLEAARERGSFAPGTVDLLLRAADLLRRHAEGGGEPIAATVAELGAAASAAPEQPPVATAGEAPAADARGERRAIRVAPEKIDTLLDLVGETVLHRRRLEHTLGEELLERRELSDELDAGGRLLSGLKDAAIGMRTLPLSTITAGLVRAVRDLGAESGREVTLTIEGAETELDRTILERLSDLLVHLIRNAVAHGIELPAERERAGKPRAGTLALTAEQRGTVVEIRLADDGRGVSAEVVEEAARTGSLLDVLARPGYSTAAGVSGLAGRGVGLDSVKAQVEAFGGGIELHSRPGSGTEAVLRLPLALALLEVLLVERAGNVYGLPLASVEEAVALEHVLALEGRQSVEVRGEPVALADLAELAGGPPGPARERAPAIVVRSGGRRVAAMCDALIGNDEVVVKGLGPLLERLDAYLGAAILGDGRIALLLDPAALVGSARSRRGAVGPSPAAAATAEAPRTPSVLVVEDSLAVRELQRSILESAGYRVQTARDGRDALDRLDAEEPVDLVVTDVDMPNLDGISLTEAIRASPSHAALPVVVVTSRGDDGDRRRGMEAGADAYMVKRDFDQQVLLDTVERLIGR